MTQILRQVMQPSILHRYLSVKIMHVLEVKVINTVCDPQIQKLVVHGWNNKNKNKVKGYNHLQFGF